MRKIVFILVLLFSVCAHADSLTSNVARNVNIVGSTANTINASGTGIIQSTCQTSGTRDVYQALMYTSASGGSDQTCIAIADNGGSDYWGTCINNGFQPTINMFARNSMGLKVNSSAPATSAASNDFLWNTSGFEIQTQGEAFLQRAGGSAATAGTFTCNGVTGVVVATTAMATTSVFAFGPNSISGTAPIGSPYISAFTAGTSFTVKCSVAGETSVYNWIMMKTA